MGCGTLLALAAAAMLASGVTSGDWVHTNEFVNPKTVGSPSHPYDDDGGRILPGGSKVSTEFGLWSACVWTKTLRKDGGSVREAYHCLGYSELNKGESLADDDPGYNALVPANENYAGAQACAVIAMILAIVCAITSGVVAFLLGDEDRDIGGVYFAAGDGEAAGRGALLGSDAGEEGGEGGEGAMRHEGRPRSSSSSSTAPVDPCAPMRGGTLFPTRGVAGRLALAAFVASAFSIVFAGATLGAWSNAAATKQIYKWAEDSKGVLQAVSGLGVTMTVAGMVTHIVFLLVLVASYCMCSKATISERARRAADAAEAREAGDRAEAEVKAEVVRMRGDLSGVAGGVAPGLDPDAKPVGVLPGSSAALGGAGDGDDGL